MVGSVLEDERQRTCVGGVYNYRAKEDTYYYYDVIILLHGITASFRCPNSNSKKAITKNRESFVVKILSYSVLATRIEHEILHVHY